MTLKYRGFLIDSYLPKKYASGPRDNNEEREVIGYEDRVYVVNTTYDEVGNCDRILSNLRSETDAMSAINLRLDKGDVLIKDNETLYAEYCTVKQRLEVNISKLNKAGLKSKISSWDL